MKKILFLICIAFLMAFSSCVTTKAYYGQEDSSSLATIIQGNNNLIINNKETSESARLIEVDGILLKGHPKHCDVLPGSHTVKIRHFQNWNDNETKQIASAVLICQGAVFLALLIIKHESTIISNALNGAVLGALPGFFIGKRTAKDKDPHQHYLVSFETDAGKAYKIMAVTNPETLETGVYVIDADTEEIIESDTELITNNY